MGQSPITIEFAGLIFAVLGGGLGVFWWLTRQFAALKRDIDAQFDALRRERSEETVRMGGKIEQLTDSLARHKLEVSEKYISKSSFTSVLDKISGELARMDTKIDARLMRIEDRLSGRNGGRPQA